jgi:hypothetical protein
MRYAFIRHSNRHAHDLPAGRGPCPSWPDGRDPPVGARQPDIREASKAKVRFVAVLRVVPILCTCVPAVPMTLVELFYR